MYHFPFLIGIVVVTVAFSNLTKETFLLCDTLVSCLIQQNFWFSRILFRTYLEKEKIHTDSNDVKPDNNAKVSNIDTMDDVNYDDSKDLFLLLE